MTAVVDSTPEVPTAPGARANLSRGSWHGYVVGYVVAWLLTGAAFALAASHILNSYSAIAAVTVLAIAQMLVHLIFFLHINTAPRHATNILAFAMTFVIIGIIVIGSIWIMSHLNANMMPMDQMMKMQR
jgi:cytochrome o ubiquinol oxidase subunit IV